jgi:tetratricopeptide (TPR) repeat protein
MSDEMEHEDWLRIRPLFRRWYHFCGRVERILFRLGIGGTGIFQHPLMRAAVNVLPFIALSLLINLAQISLHYAQALKTPVFARLAPDTSSAAAWVAAWAGGWFHALAPVGLPPLSPPFTLAPEGRLAAWGLPLLLAAIVLVAWVFHGRRWAHYLALLLAASLVILLPSFALPRPAALADILQAEKNLYWLLPIPCLLVAALLAELGRSWAGAGLVLLAVLGLLDTGRIQSLRSPVPFHPGLLRQFAGTPVEQTEKGLELARQGRLAEAGEAYRKVVGTWPDYAPAWDAWGQAAYRLATRKQEDFSKAVLFFDTACYLDPEDSNHQLRLAEACRRCYLAAEGPGHQRIFQEFNELIARHPSQAVLRQRLALVYLEQRSVQDALGLMEEAAALAPDNAGYRAFHGLLCILCSEPVAARDELQAAAALDPASVPARFGLAWLCVNETPAGAGLAGHLDALRRHAAASPTVQIMGVLGAAAAGRADETRALADAASRNHPDDLFLQVIVARILLLHGNRGVRSPETALAILRRAQSMPSFASTARAWQILAAAQDATGDNAAACESMERAVLAAEAKQEGALADICRAQAALLAARRPLAGGGMNSPLEKTDMTEILLRFLHEEEARITEP